MTSIPQHIPILIDLFSGCGGFSKGAYLAGFEVAFAYDNDPVLSSSFPINFPRTRHFVRDVATLTGGELRDLAGREIHGIFGGPPCQGFSDIGKRLKTDPRRELLGHFFRIVAEAKPTFFVMENVRGLAYSDARDVLDRALARVSADYTVLGPCILDASHFGAATRRPRLFVIGVHKNRGKAVSLTDIAVRKRPPATVRAAIGDLLGATEEVERDGFDCWRITRAGRPSDYAKSLRESDRRFTGHRPTVHTDAVIERFKQLRPGDIDHIGRHPRLAWDGQCPTLRAGTGSDRGSYQSVRPIHPEFPRVITVREAARLQGFPDGHVFHPTIWHSFRMIGNSVSPMVARAIFESIASRVPAIQQFAAAAE